MRALVTGATGAMGSYLVPRLLVEGYAVLGIEGWARPVWDERKAAGAEYEGGIDLASRPLDQIVRLWRPTDVFHLASRANVHASFDDPFTAIDNNIRCTLTVLEAMRLHAPKARLVHCSSSEVYGRLGADTLERGVSEEAPIAPVSPYAASKAAQEMLIASYVRSFGLNAVITRAFGYVNPRRTDLALTSFAMQLWDTGKVRHGNLDSVRTFCDARDIADAYLLAAQHGGSGEVYNIGSTAPVRIADALTMLAAVAKADPEAPADFLRIRDESLLRPADVTWQVPNVSKFVRLTHWAPKYSFDQSLQWLWKEVRNGRAR